MKRSWLRPSAVVLAVAILILAAGCDDLPPNFWANKWGEIINRSIFGIINAALGIATGGTVQI